MKQNFKLGKDELQSLPPPRGGLKAGFNMTHLRKEVLKEVNVTSLPGLGLPLIMGKACAV